MNVPTKDLYIVFKPPVLVRPKIATYRALKSLLLTLKQI